MSLATRSTRPAAPEAASAARLRAPSWRDPRLLVGLLLVLTSVVAGAQVVSAAASTTPVWAAARTLVPGEEVTADDLVSVGVHLDGGADGYTSARTAPAAGTVVLREVSAGDLVPKSALGAAADLTTRPVGLPVTGPVPSGLVAGALVDVWVVPPARRTGAAAVSAATSSTGATAASTSGSTSDGPRQLAASAVVAEVTTDGGSFSSGRGAVVQVRLEPDELREALQALADDADVSLVLVPGTAPAAQG